MSLASVAPPFEFDAERHEFRKDGLVVPSVTQVLARAGICDFSFVEEEARIHAMKRGTSVHWLLQLEDEGALNYRTVPRSLRGYRKAYKTWKQRSGFVPLSVEKQFVSSYGYAGIVDRTGLLENAAVVLDFKTGAIPSWVGLQLAAYSAGLLSTVAIARCVRRIALSLRPDGTYKIREFPLRTWDSDFAKFIHELGKVKDAGNSN